MQEAFKEIQPPVTLHFVDDGDEALEFLKRANSSADAPAPSLIFLDFNLPKADSRELLRQIKLDARWRLIPIAVLTTSNSEKDVRDAYELQANCFLTKAADLDGFFRVIRSATHFWLDVASLPQPDTRPPL